MTWEEFVENLTGNPAAAILDDMEEDIVRAILRGDLEIPNIPDNIVQRFNLNAGDLTQRILANTENVVSDIITPMIDAPTPPVLNTPNFQAFLDAKFPPGTTPFNVLSQSNAKHTIQKAIEYGQLLLEDVPVIIRSNFDSPFSNYVEFLRDTYGPSANVSNTVSQVGIREAIQGAIDNGRLTIFDVHPAAYAFLDLRPRIVNGAIRLNSQVTRTITQLRAMTNGDLAFLLQGKTPKEISSILRAIDETPVGSNSMGPVTQRYLEFVTQQSRTQTTGIRGINQPKILLIPPNSPTHPYTNINSLRWEDWLDRRLSEPFEILLEELPREDFRAALNRAIASGELGIDDIPHNVQEFFDISNGRTFVELDSMRRSGLLRKTVLFGPDVISPLAGPPIRPVPNILPRLTGTRVIPRISTVLRSLPRRVVGCVARSSVRVGQAIGRFAKNSLRAAVRSAAARSLGRALTRYGPLSFILDGWLASEAAAGGVDIYAQMLALATRFNKPIEDIFREYRAYRQEIRNRTESLLGDGDSRSVANVEREIEEFPDFEIFLEQQFGNGPQCNQELQPPPRGCPDRTGLTDQEWQVLENVVQAYSSPGGANQILNGECSLLQLRDVSNEIFNRSLYRVEYAHRDNPYVLTILRNLPRNRQLPNGAAPQAPAGSGNLIPLTTTNVLGPRSTDQMDNVIRLMQTLSRVSSMSPGAALGLGGNNPLKNEIDDLAWGVNDNFTSIQNQLLSGLDVSSTLQANDLVLNTAWNQLNNIMLRYNINEQQVLQQPLPTPSSSFVQDFVEARRSTPSCNMPGIVRPPRDQVIIRPLPPPKPTGDPFQGRIDDVIIPTGTGGIRLPPSIREQLNSAYPIRPEQPSILDQPIPIANPTRSSLLGPRR